MLGSHVLAVAPGSVLDFVPRKEQTGVHHCHSQAASSAQLGLVRLWPGVVCTR